MNKICLQCGYENDENAKFCIRCGAQFHLSAKRESEPVPSGEKDAVREQFAGGGSAETSAPADASSTAGPDAETGANEKRIRAEWQGSNCRCAIDGETSGNFSSEGPYGAPSDASTQSAAYYAAQRREWKEKAALEAAVNKRKTLFILAFVGLLLDMFVGIGALICLPVAVIASVYFFMLYKTQKKVSSQLLWAMVVGYVGTIVGVVFFILLL